MKLVSILRSLIIAAALLALAVPANATIFLGADPTGNLFGGSLSSSPLSIEFSVSQYSEVFR